MMPTDPSLLPAQNPEEPSSTEAPPGPTTSASSSTLRVEDLDPTEVRDLWDWYLKLDT